MADKKVVAWFTVNGRHIPVYEGESKSDAFKRVHTDGKSVHPKTTAGYKKLQPTTKEAVEHYEQKLHEKINAESKAHKEWEEKSLDWDASRSDKTKAYDKYKKANEEANSSYQKFINEGEKPKIKSVKFKKKSIPEQNEDIKEKQIARAKAESDRLNGKQHKSLTRTFALSESTPDKRSAWDAAYRDISAALSNKEITLDEYLKASKRLKELSKKWFNE